VRVRKAHLEFVSRARVVRVATADGQGRPHVVPVCHVVRDGRVYFASGLTGRKVADLRANPVATVTADDYTEAWDQLRGVTVTGPVRLHARNATFRRIRRLLYAKYPQYPEESALGDRDSLVVEVTPARVFAWGW
jgi:nitroimidazol reductase NimA-like FMN-containing flavoprotein (pyridoxamine 5'-phosphate oxidase superfamily)